MPSAFAPRPFTPPPAAFLGGPESLGPQGSAMRRTPAAPTAAPESALSRLLEVETRLEAMLEEAHAQAEATLREARNRAAARGVALVAELATVDAELAVTLAAKATAQMAEQRDALTRVRSRYEVVDDRGVEA